MRAVKMEAHMGGWAHVHMGFHSHCPHEFFQNAFILGLVFFYMSITLSMNKKKKQDCDNGTSPIIIPLLHPS
jgi:hypothetical protein